MATIEKFEEIGATRSRVTVLNDDGTTQAGEFEVNLDPVQDSILTKLRVENSDTDFDDLNARYPDFAGLAYFLHAESKDGRKVTLPWPIAPYDPENTHR